MSSEMMSSEMMSSEMMMSSDMMMSSEMMSSAAPEHAKTPSPYTAGSYYDPNIIDDHDAYFAKYYPDGNFDKHIVEGTDTTVP